MPDYEPHLSQKWLKCYTMGSNFLSNCMFKNGMLSLKNIRLVFSSHTRILMREHGYSVVFTQRKWKRLKLILNWINLALKQETGAREIVGHNNSNKTTTSNGLYPIVNAMAYHWNFTTKGKLTIELHLKLYEINWDERRKNTNKTTNFLHVLEL